MLPETWGYQIDDEDDCQACSFVESPSGGDDNEYEEEDDE